MNSSRGRTPAQNSMAKAMPMNTIALPRSGCLSTRRNGTPTMSPGIEQVAERARRLLPARTGSGPASAPWPPWPAPTAGRSGARRPRASCGCSAPCPPRCPTTSTTPSSTRLKAYSAGASHSSSRSETWNTTQPGHDADAEPEELAVPDAGGAGRHVGLPGRVEREQAEQHQAEAHPEEPPVERGGPHGRSPARRTLSSRACAAAESGSSSTGRGAVSWGRTASSSRTFTLIGADGVRARGCSGGASGRRTAPPWCRARRTP